MDPTVNPRIIQLGELIHDALLRFYQYDTEAAHEIYSDTLEGGCAIAAAFLVRAIRNRLKIKADFVAADCHAWVESGGIIYDPTAIQFDRESPKVKTIIADEADYFPYKYANTRRIKSVNREWPLGQRPKSFSLIWNGNIPYFRWNHISSKRKAV